MKMESVLMLIVARLKQSSPLAHSRSSPFGCFCVRLFEVFVILQREMNVNIVGDCNVQFISCSVNCTFDLTRLESRTLLVSPADRC